MSADPLVDTYARYKKGTSRLIEWLCDSAKDCGINIDTSTDGKTKVPSATLLAYTTRIVQSVQPKIDIPLAILHVAQDVIAGRKLCHRFYMTFASQDDASNKRHKHFINTLEKIREDLRREYKSRLPKRKKHIPAVSENDMDFTNIFSHLELKDTNSSIGDLADSRSQPDSDRVRAKRNKGRDMKVDPKPGSVLYEFGDEDEEARFAVWCLLEDFGQTRTQVQILWDRYARGEISLMTAACLTSHTFTLLKSLCNKFNMAHEEYDSYAAIVDLVGIDSHMEAIRNSQASRALSEGTMNHVEPSSEPTTSNTKAQNLLCLEAWQTLHDFQQLQWSILMPEKDDFKGKQPHMIKSPPLFGRHLYNISTRIFNLIATKNLAKSSRRAKDMDTIWAEICDYIDPYTKMLCEVTNADNFLDAAAVHVTQICFDISDVLDGHLDRAMQESIEIIERLRSACDEAILVYEQKAASGNVYFWTMSPNLVVNKLRGIRDMVQRGQHQHGIEGWTVRAADCLDPEAGVFVPLDLIRAIPFLPVHIARIALKQFMWDGVQYCNCNLISMSAAHLYNAATLFGCPQERWPDMEFFLSSQPTAFLRQGDGSMISAAKQFSLALGVPLLTLTSSKNARPRLPSMQKCLERAVLAQKCDTIQDSCNAVRKGGERLLAMDVLYEAVRQHAANSGIQNPIIAAQFDSTKKLSTAQLLEVLTEIISSEERYLCFNYWSFTNLCATWLSNVATLHDYETKRVQPIGTWEIVHNILWHAAKTEERDEPRKPTVVYRAGMELSHVLRAKDCRSDSLSNSALSLSSDTLAQQRRPRIRYAGLGQAELPKVLHVVESLRSRKTCDLVQLKTWELAQVGKAMLTIDAWRIKRQNIDQNEEEAAEYRKYVGEVLGSFSGQMMGDEQIDDMIIRKHGRLGGGILPSAILLSTALHWS